ncbi:DUF2497 domain-containing protein [Sphingomonadaceae bacterium]|nr:DUF2497 domain-containing protein [Sphingomonadaceae bacterium]
MQQDGESSVEEILESIKKVIARDNRAGAVETRRRRSREGVAEEAAETRPEPVADDEAEEILELGETEIVAEDEFDDETLDDSAEENGGFAEATPLVAENVRASMQENFAALSMISQPGAQPQIVRSGETSLEGMVRDMLRPMLAEWLDSNLPEMTERIIKAEISRIAGKRD